MSEPDNIPAVEFWAELEKSGVGLTDRYASKGASRFCTQKDGEFFTVSVHEYYPRYMVNKVLEENGFFHVSLYNNIDAT